MKTKNIIFMFVVAIALTFSAAADSASADSYVSLTGVIRGVWMNYSDTCSGYPIDAAGNIGYGTVTGQDAWSGRYGVWTTNGCGTSVNTGGDGYETQYYDCIVEFNESIFHMWEAHPAGVRVPYYCQPGDIKVCTDVIVTSPDGRYVGRDYGYARTVTCDNECDANTCTTATCWNGLATVQGTKTCNVDNGCAASTCTGQQCWNSYQWVSGTKTCNVDNGCAANTCSGQSCWNSYQWVSGTKTCNVDNGCAASTCTGLTCWNSYANVNGTKTTGECASPTGLTSTCNTAGNSVTVKWNSVSGAAGYYLRIDDKTDPWYTAANDTLLDPSASTTFTKPSALDTRPVVPGRAYDWWVHAMSGSNYSPPVFASFTCTCTPSCAAPSTKCSGQVITDANGCGTCPSGTSTTGACCVDTTWSPAAAAQCSGTTFTQTSDNCNWRTQPATGIKNCLNTSNWREVTP